MLRTTIAVAMITLLAGCGKSEAPAPAAPAETAPAAEAAAPAPEAAAPAPEAAVPAPESAAPAAETAAPAAGVAPTADVTAAPAATTAVAGNGKDTYDKVCSICHGAGVAGAPKIGDKADWGPRIAQGKPMLYDHAIKGFMGQKGMMPPKGANTALSDADVQAAVDYMVSQAE